jgi:hypothetical protein
MEMVYGVKKSKQGTQKLPFLHPRIPENDKIRNQCGFFKVVCREGGT